MPRIEIAAARREADPDAEPLVVSWYGEDFVCERVQNQWALMEMAGAFADGEMAVMSAFFQFLQTVFVPDDWERFCKLNRKNRVGFEDLQLLVTGIAEAVTARPIPQPSASPVGLPPTGASSRVVSFSPGTMPHSA